jgi:hypothetical protein
VAIAVLGEHLGNPLAEGVVLGTGEGQGHPPARLSRVPVTPRFLHSTPRNSARETVLPREHVTQRGQSELALRPATVIGSETGTWLKLTNQSLPFTWPLWL